jgi:hypothetical protein
MQYPGTSNLINVHKLRVRTWSGWLERIERDVAEATKTIQAKVADRGHSKRKSGARDSSIKFSSNPDAPPAPGPPPKREEQPGGMRKGALDEDVCTS